LLIVNFRGFHTLGIFVQVHSLDSAQILQQNDIQQLIGLYNAGRLTDAARQAEAYIQRFPTTVFLYNIRGSALLDLGNFEDAVLSFCKVIELEPESPEAHNNLGLAQQRAGANDGAVDSYREAVRLKPEFAEAHNNLGVLLSDLGQVEAAIDSYRTALFYDPEFAEAYNNLGAALTDLNQTGEAIDAYRKALQRNPDYAEAHNNLGILQQRQKRWDDALESYQRALNIEPRYAGAHNNLGSALQDIGRLDEALESYQRALTAQPNLSETINNLGNIYRQLDRFEEAIDSFNKLLVLDPDNAEAHNNLGVVYKECGRFEEAKDCYRRALDLKPNFVDARLNLGGALLHEEKFDEAIECYRIIDPLIESSKVSALVLECYYRKGDRTAYDIQIQMIKARQPTYNFRAGATAAFVANQYNSNNVYSFCEDPVEKVAVFNTLEDNVIDQTFIDELCKAIESSGANERFAPGHISEGYKSVGNLFAKGIPEFVDLESIIRTYTDKYYALHEGERSLFVQKWPQDFVLDGWYIRLLQGGEISAHTHSAWLSGIFYLKLPNKKGGDEGNIEFTLCGYELPVIKDDYPRQMVETKPGALVLFPSSLPHRVVPFTSDEERICLPFDIIPK
jgi:tetratricopeptide (TPR) repeat protein